MENQEKTSLPKLVADIRVKEKTLVADYGVKNTTETPIYIFSARWEMNEKGAFLAEQQLYVYLADDDTLYLSKKIPKLPLLQSVELREIPYVRKIEPNGEFRESVTLKLPVEEFNPYFPKLKESETKELVAERVGFEIQFIRESEELKVEETGIKDVWKVWHPNLFGNVESLETRLSPIEVKVNKRVDGFDGV